MTTTDQMGMFDLGDQPPPAPASAAVAPAGRSRGKSRPQRPEMVVEVLHNIHLGDLGVLDDTDRVVLFEDDDRVRLYADEDVVLSLLRQGYVQRRPPRDTASCLHGAIRKPVTPLRLTKAGVALRARWSAYQPLP